MTAVTLTIDLEDPTGMYAPDGRYVAMAGRLLDFCGETQRRATFFTVGRAAMTAPKLIKAITTRGHEIAYHSHDHVVLTEETPQRFERETRTDKDMIEQLTGQKLIGFRAPCFSLTPKTLWAVDVLGGLGFRYSSSVMPTRISRFGFPGAPRAPFRWPNGLIELPLPVGPFGAPYLGGVYLYALPFFFVRFLARRAGTEECLWTYAHPFDFDVDEPFQRARRTPAWVSRVMWMLRHRAEGKIRRVLALGEAGTLGERILNEDFSSKLLCYQPIVSSP